MSTQLESQEATAKNNPNRLEPGSPYAPCIRCFSKATWDVNGYPYCETCAKIVEQRFLVSHKDGVISRFHSPTGLVWAESGLYPADFGENGQ